MVKYLLRRLLVFIPTLLIISFLAFALSKLAPGDPVLTLNPALREGDRFRTIQDREATYLEAAKTLSLDKPAFYFNINSIAFPDTLYKILQPLPRQTIRSLIHQSGNSAAVQEYYNAIKSLDQQIALLPDSMVTTNTKSFTNALKDLYNNAEPSKIQNRLSSMQMILDKNVPLIPYLGYGFQELQKRYQLIFDKAQRWKLFIPSIHWYGFNNQYHDWLTNFLTGNFGKSYVDGRPVNQKIVNPLWRTLLMDFLAILLAFGISIPIGVHTAMLKGQWFDRFITILLFTLYSLPTFWIGTLLIIFFTNSEYGMDWFPTLGLSSVADDAPFWTVFWDTAYHLILPVFCLTYGSLAFISRQMRNSTDAELNKLYILSARARGLSWKQVTWKHAFRNALFPIITLFASVFPALLAGSFVVEYIFNIPGMGLITLDAIRNSDWPVVYAILMLSSLFTVIGILVSDLLYVWLNPRVSFKS